MRYLTLVAAFGCASVASGPTAATTPESSGTGESFAPLDSPADAPPIEGEICRAAREQAFEVRRVSTTHASTLGSASADDFECAVSDDFNGDGVADFYVAFPESPVFYLFVLRTPALYVGSVASDRMYGFGCSVEQANGMCVFQTSREMHHGETMSLNYVFNGHLYEERDHSYTSPEP